MGFLCSALLNTFFVWNTGSTTLKRAAANPHPSEAEKNPSKLFIQILTNNDILDNN